MSELESSCASSVSESDCVSKLEIDCELVSELESASVS